eukprot:9325661-Alexandrium_andersonii.AAC.1
MDVEAGGPGQASMPEHALGGGESGDGISAEIREGARDEASTEAGPAIPPPPVAPAAPEPAEPEIPEDCPACLGRHRPHSVRCRARKFGPLGRRVRPAAAPRDLPAIAEQG